jgi:preprotein translocase subunit YajC
MMHSFSLRPAPAQSRKKPVANSLERRDGSPSLSGSMEFLTLLAQAAPAGAPQPPVIFQFLPLIIIAVLFYFLLIRPQQKKQKEHQQLVSSVKTGDKVVTSAGIHGIVANVKETTLLIKVADNVKIEMDKAAVASVLKSSENA